MRGVILALGILASSLNACSADDVASTTLASAGSALTPRYGKTLVAECKGMNGSPEACLWWYRAPVALRAEKAKRLVIYFAGGDQGCAIPQIAQSEIYGGVAKSYVEAGYVFVCANIFENLFTSWAGKIPYNEEAKRIDSLVRSVRKSPAIGRLWTGDELLFSGISHGASAPVLAMARTRFDDQAEWKGKRKTGACFLDGQYDIYYNQQWWQQPANKDSCEFFVDRTVCGRYFGQKTCAGDASNGKMDKDSLVDVLGGEKRLAKGDFAIKNWKLVECGSAIGGCDIGGKADMLPAAPISRLCDEINGLGDSTCAFHSAPESSHAECGLHGVADTQCIDWFNQK